MKNSGKRVQMFHEPRVDTPRRYLSMIRYLTSLRLSVRFTSIRAQILNASGTHEVLKKVVVSKTPWLLSCFSSSYIHRSPCCILHVLRRATGDGVTSLGGYQERWHTSCSKLHAPRTSRFPNCRLYHPFQFAFAVDEISMDVENKMSAERGTLLLHTKKRDFFGKCFIANCRRLSLEIPSLAPRFRFPPQSASHNPTIPQPPNPPKPAPLRTSANIHHHQGKAS
jgi:hypothetical protein